MLLDNLVKIDDLRMIWKHEAYDFSKWLSELNNLKQLGDELGLNISNAELESSVGKFSVDMFALEEISGRKIIIENQLEDTNHDHLGKIITYAAGKSADIIIWIVKRARDEHKQAIEWLNRNTDQNIGFFLIEIELWKIGDSLPAPKFNIVEKPNDWAKTMKTVDSLSETGKLNLDFWQEFVTYSSAINEFNTVFNKRKPQPQNWYDLSVGTSELHISLTAITQKKRIGVELYISDNKELFKRLIEKKEYIESYMGSKLEWIEASKDCRLLLSNNGNIKDGSIKWNVYFDWYIQKALKFKELLKEIYL